MLDYLREPHDALADSDIDGYVYILCGSVRRALAALLWKRRSREQDHTHIYIYTCQYVSQPTRRAAHVGTQAARDEPDPTKSTLTAAFCVQPLLTILGIFCDFRSTWGGNSFKRPHRNAK